MCENYTPAPLDLPCLCLRFQFGSKIYHFLPSPQAPSCLLPANFILFKVKRKGMILQNGVGWGAVPFYSPFSLDLQKQGSRQSRPVGARNPSLAPCFYVFWPVQAFEFGCTSDRWVRDSKEEGDWGRGKSLVEGRQLLNHHARL